MTRVIFFGTLAVLAGAMTGGGVAIILGASAYMGAVPGAAAAFALFVGRRFF
jgi:hypothetical protein